MEKNPQPPARPPREKGGKSPSSKTGKPRGRHPPPASRKRHRSNVGRVPEAEYKAAAQREKKVKRSKSYFTELRETLSDAEKISAFIKEHQEKGLNDTKMLHTFMQALSGRSEALYTTLFHDYTGEVVLILEFLYALLTMKKVTVIPAVHEFILRCKKAQVDSEEWGEKVRRLEGVQPSLFTPAQILAKLCEVDPLGQVQRKIEISNTVGELVECFDSLSSLLFSKVKENEEGESDGDVEEGGEEGKERLTYAQRCQLLSKFLSKARRVATGKPKGAEGKESDTVEEDPTAAPKEDEEEGDHTHTDGDGSTSLSEEDKEIFKKLVGKSVKLFEKVMVTKPENASLQPLAKFTSFVKWCKENGLIQEKHLHVIESFEAHQEEDIGEQAAQLETVMKLKTIHKDNELNEEGLLELLEELWTAGGETHFEPCSVDVLSSIGTAASLKGLSDTAADLICQRLLQTHPYLKEKGVELPRRALRFIDSVQHRQKQALVSKQLATEGIMF